MATVTDVDANAARGRGHTALELDATRLPTAVTPLVVLVAAAVAGASALGYAALVAILGIGGLVLVLGWPRLLDAPAPTEVRIVLLVGVLLQTVTMAATKAPRLTWMPLAVAIGVVGALVQQLAQAHRGGRVTAGAAASVSALAVLASGLAMAPLADRPLGPRFLLVAMAGIAAGALAELSGRHRRIRGAAVLVVLVAGALGSWLTAALFADGVKAMTAIGLGMLVASLSYSMRHVLGALTGREAPWGQAALVVASVLVPGVCLLALGQMAGV